VTTSFDTVATPPGAALPDVVASPDGIRALCDALKAARPALWDRDAIDLAEALGRVGERFLDPGDLLRQEALDFIPSTSGLSPAMASAVLDGMARDWTASRLRALLEAELGDPSVLDRFVDAAGPEGGRGRRVMAVGPALCVQIVAGSVPGVGVNALLRSLLVKGPTLLKPGRGDVVLPVLFARALADADRGLASSLAVVYWPGGHPTLENAALEAADVVTAYGSDATVRELRTRVPVATRFVPYHHRVSVGVVGREALSGEEVRGTALDVARAVALFDQRGCVSPQLVLVEEGGETSAASFAEQLGTALSDLETVLPSGPVDAAEASALHQARGVAELTAGAASARVIHGGRATWSVLLGAHLEDLAAFPATGRVARVRPIGDLGEASALLEPFSANLQSVGFAGLGARLEGFARLLARQGVTRVVPFAAMPFPPAWWHHDGSGPLRALLSWVDLEA